MVRRTTFGAVAGAALILNAGTASASVLDNPIFEILGLVIVAGTDSAPGGASITNPVVGDFVIGVLGGFDLNTADIYPVVTGTLDALPDTAGTAITVTDALPGPTDIDADSSGDGFVDENDTITTFDIDASTDIDLSGSDFTSSFYVASNTPFNLEGTVSVATNDFSGSGIDENDVDVVANVTVSGNDAGFAFGSAAQSPDSGGTSDVLDGGIDDLGDYGGTIFTGDQQTAASTGTIAEQMVRFDFIYSLGSDLNDLSAGTGTLDIDVTYTVAIP